MTRSSIVWPCHTLIKKLITHHVPTPFTKKYVAFVFFPSPPQLLFLSKATTSSN
jgi:hypothetical protein